MIEKRIEKRKWRARRAEILMDYENFSYYTVSTALVIFDLAWKISQENNASLWLVALILIILCSLCGLDYQL